MGSKGDFNSITSYEEKRGVEGVSRLVEMEEFKAFINNMELFDIQVSGSLFTWIKPNGKPVVCWIVSCYQKGLLLGGK